MNKFLKVVALMAIPALFAFCVRSLAVDRRLPRPIVTYAEEDSTVPARSLAIAGIEADSPLLDATERQVVMYERDSITGSTSYSVNGSPVQVKLKAYIDAALEEQNLPLFIDNPDGESHKWVEIPMPLYLALTKE